MRNTRYCNLLGADAQNVLLAAQDQTQDEMGASDLRRRWAEADVSQIRDFAVEARRLRGILGPNDDLTPVINDLIHLEGLMDPWRRVEQRLERYFEDTPEEYPGPTQEP